MRFCCVSPASEVSNEVAASCYHIDVGGFPEMLHHHNFHQRLHSQMLSFRSRSYSPPIAPKVKAKFQMLRLSGLQLHTRRITKFERYEMLHGQAISVRQQYVLELMVRCKRCCLICWSRLKARMFKCRRLMCGGPVSGLQI